MTDPQRPDTWQAMGGDARRLAQAMWDARAILGFDNDGDPTPAASITDGVQPFIDMFLADMQSERADYENLLDEWKPAE